mgnify:CR=1 FL=1
MRYLSLWLLFIVSFTLHAQDYFPKNDGVKQSFKNFTAIQNATIYLSATQKIENATLLIKENKIVFKPSKRLKARVAKATYEQLK